MGFVDDDGERAAPVFIADLVKDKGEFLDGGYGDLLARLEKGSEVARPLRMTDDGRHLGELLDSVSNLLVEHPSVGDNDDGVEHRSVVFGQADELMCQPGDRV